MTNAARDFIEKVLKPWLESRIISCQASGSINCQSTYETVAEFVDENCSKWDKPNHVSAGVVDEDALASVITRTIEHLRIKHVEVEAGAMACIIHDQIELLEDILNQAESQPTIPSDNSKLIEGLEKVKNSFDSIWKDIENLKRGIRYKYDYIAVRNMLDNIHAKCRPHWDLIAAVEQIEQQTASDI